MTTRADVCLPAAEMQSKMANAPSGTRALFIVTGTCACACVRVCLVDWLTRVYCVTGPTEPLLLCVFRDGF